MTTRQETGWDVMRLTIIASFVGMTIVLGLMSMASAEAAKPYRLHPGDVIEISVIEDPNLNRRVLVGPDGRITLPLAGAITAGGQTLERVQAAVRSALASNFVRPPTVTASLIALAPPALPEAATAEEEKVLNDVYVVGEVSRPGRYQYDSEKPISVLQALAMAGGPGVYAARKRIQVRTTVDGAEKVQIFNYDAVEDGDGAAPTEALADGAVIVVPERGLFH